MFGGLAEMEEEFLKDLNTNNQKLDNIIASVRGLMKIDPKARKAGVSPIGKSIIKGN
jgi:hypothetical protein